MSTVGVWCKNSATTSWADLAVEEEKDEAGAQADFLAELHDAVQDEDVERAATLLRSFRPTEPYDVPFKLEGDVRPLSLLGRVRGPRMLELFITHRARIDGHWVSPFDWNATRVDGRPCIFKFAERSELLLLLLHAPIHSIKWNARDKAGYTLLHRMAQKASPSAVDCFAALARKSETVVARTPSGLTALEIAIDHGDAGRLFVDAAARVPLPPSLAARLNARCAENGWPTRFVCLNESE